MRIKHENKKTFMRCISCSFNVHVFVLYLILTLNRRYVAINFAKVVLNEVKCAIIQRNHNNDGDGDDDDDGHSDDDEDVVWPLDN